MENGTMKIIHDIKSISAKRRELLRKEAYEAFQSGITGHSFARTHKFTLKLFTAGIENSRSMARKRLKNKNGDRIKTPEVY